MLLNEILNEMTQGEVSYMQRELNAIYKPIGIKFVITKHVMDRVNNTDGREKTVSPEEIISTFKKIYNQHGSKFENFYKFLGFDFSNRDLRNVPQSLFSILL